MHCSYFSLGAGARCRLLVGHRTTGPREDDLDSMMMVFVGGMASWSSLVPNRSEFSIDYSSIVERAICVLND
ncbi:hypothetical protein TIFTF001_021173 [Ficus carica]|uniref:Uncharacterized protein n=1 Tax=Ficus carica TaxID=3494 RepID=A0AA88AC59_FICCA|nr:hypothetical protein TIFTF001_021173 [Ficus carica]